MFNRSFNLGQNYEVFIIDDRLKSSGASEKEKRKVLEQITDQILAKPNDIIRQFSHIVFTLKTGEKAVMKIPNGNLAFLNLVTDRYSAMESRNFDAVYDFRRPILQVQHAKRMRRNSATFLKERSDSSNNQRQVILLPGYRTKCLCGYLFSLKFNQEVVNPNLADLHHEILQAEAKRKPRWTIRIIENRGRIGLIFSILKNCFLNLVDVILKAKKVVK